jgi:superfamily II DNA/RNA helicase
VKMAHLYELLLVGGPLPEGDGKAAASGARALALAKKALRDKGDEEMLRRMRDDEEQEGLHDAAKHAQRAGSVLVFVDTVRDCEIVAQTLRELGWDVAALHSAMHQAPRLAALTKFKAEKVHVLVATDVASRGLDIPVVDLVVNYDVPRDPADYVHRVGRTARAGRAGRAVALVTERDVDLVHAIERTTHTPLQLEWRVCEAAVLVHLTRVSAAQRVARLALAEDGFEAVLAEHGRRKLQARQRSAAFFDDEPADAPDAPPRARDRSRRREPPREERAAAADAPRGHKEQSDDTKPHARKRERDRADSGGRKRARA